MVGRFTLTFFNESRAYKIPIPAVTSTLISVLLPPIAHSETITPEFIRRRPARSLRPLLRHVYRMAAQTDQCCATCTFHVHRDPSMVVSECGACTFHRRCLGLIAKCGQCCLPVGTVDETVLTVCNVGRCQKPGGVLCVKCGDALADRFARHLSRMGKLTAQAVRGWVTSFGNLRDGSRSAVTNEMVSALTRECSRGFLVRFSSDGSAEYFTESLANLSRQHLEGPVSYSQIVALDPRLPPEAAGALRRFVSETRRYWCEHPKTKLAMNKPTQARRIAEPKAAGVPLMQVADPGNLVISTEKGALALARKVRKGTMHMFGRDVFYFESQIAPKTARQSRKRAAEWLGILK